MQDKKYAICYAMKSRSLWNFFNRLYLLLCKDNTVVSDFLWMDLVLITYVVCLERASMDALPKITTLGDRIRLKTQWILLTIERIQQSLFGEYYITLLANGMEMKSIVFVLYIILHRLLQANSVERTIQAHASLRWAEVFSWSPYLPVRIRNVCSYPEGGGTPSW